MAEPQTPCASLSNHLNSDALAALDSTNCSATRRFYSASRISTKRRLVCLQPSATHFYSKPSTVSRAYCASNSRTCQSVANGFSDKPFSQARRPHSGSISKMSDTITSKAPQQARNNKNASAANRTRGPSMATMDFTTKPLTLGVSWRPDVLRRQSLRFCADGGQQGLGGVVVLAGQQASGPP